MALPGSYKISFSDLAKKSNSGNRGYFVIEPNTTNGTVHPTSSKLSLQSTASETSLLHFGKDVENYGERIAENFVHLLENFASPIEPKNPIHGQMWVKSGHSYEIVQEELHKTVSDAPIVIIQGDHFNRFDAIKNQPFSNNSVVNPQGAVRIINPDDESVIIGNPIDVNLSTVTGNTEIKFPKGTFNNVTSVKGNYLTVALNRSTVLWYDDQYYQNGTPKWKPVHSAFISDNEPDDPYLGDFWIDTSFATPVLKYYNGSTFTDGFLPRGGGELTGELYLTGNTPTQNNQATDKQYVDSTINSTITPIESNITSLENDVSSLDSRLTTAESDITSLENNLSSLETQHNNEVNSIQNDISSINNTLPTKLDLTGGTMNGSITFEVPEANESFGVVYQGLAGFANHSLNFVGEGNVLTTGDVNYILALNAPGSNQNSSFKFTYFSQNDNVATNIAEIRKTGVITQQGTFEVDPSTINTSAALPATNKYQTQDEVDTTIANLGNILVAFDTDWDSSNKQLTLGAVNNNVILDLEHTHTTADLNISYDPGSSVREKLYDIYTTDIDISTAIRTLDLLTPSYINPNLENHVENTIVVPTIGTTQSSDQVTISNSDNNGIAVGDHIKFKQEATPEEYVYQFGSLSGTDSTGLNNDSTTYTMEIIYDNRINNIITVSEQGQNLQTWNDIRDAITNASTLSGSPSMQYGFATLDNGDLHIVSDLAGPLSSVFVNSDNLISETSQYINSSPSPTITINGSTEEEVTSMTAVTNVTTSGSPAETTITVTSGSIQGLTDQQLALVEFATLPEQTYDLATKKYVDENTGSGTAGNVLVESGTSFDPTYDILTIGGTNNNVTVDLSDLSGSSGTDPYSSFNLLIETNTTFDSSTNILTIGGEDNNVTVDLSDLSDPYSNDNLLIETNTTFDSSTKVLTFGGTSNTTTVDLSHSHSYIPTLPSSVDHSIPRFDGTSGDTLQQSDLIVTDNGNSYGVGVEIVETTSTSYTITASDKGKLIKFTASSNITVTFPEQSTTTTNRGFSVGLLQAGSGAVVPATEGNDSIVNPDGDTQTATQWAVAHVTLVTAGSPNTWLFDGRTA